MNVARGQRLPVSSGQMEELDLERPAPPALLALLLLGTFVMLATNGGGDPAAAPARQTLKPAP